MKNKFIEKIKDKSPLIPQRNKIINLLSINQRNLNEKQKQFLELSLNKDVKLMFVEGPAGSSKTFMAVYSSLLLMNQRRISDIVFVRSVVESSEKSIGFLPGLVSDKLSPYTQPLIDKLEEFLPKNEIDYLKKDERITGIPIGFLRGLNFNAKSLILDETQNCTFKEIFTFITRIGKFSKVFVIGDCDQSDLKNGNRGGFEKMISCFNDDESRKNGIFVFKFTSDDIVRSELVKFIVNKINKNF